MDVKAVERLINSNPSNEEVNEIFEWLELADDAYHNTGEPIASDADYDKVYKWAKTHYGHYSYFLTEGSETRGEKVALPYPMGGLDQIYEGDAASWMKPVVYIVTEKLDGSSAMVVYDSKGNLYSAYTRGNGFEGHDITRHFKRIKNVPQHAIPNLVVRGEVVFPLERFEELKQNGELDYKNPRNFVAGQLNKKESLSIFVDNVHFVAFDTPTGLSNSKKDDYDKLAEAGFITPKTQIVKLHEEIDETLTDILNRFRSTGVYEIDGVVLEPNNFSDRELYDYSDSLRPKWAKKFKVGAENNLATVRVKDVIWNVTKRGYLKPRVSIEPVDLMGVTISFATGFNAKFIKDNGIGPGAEIVITRSGDVIPYILETVTKATPKLPEDYDYVWSENEVDIFIEEMTDTQQFKILNDFFSQIEVDFLRAGNLQQMVDAGLDSIEKIIKATKNDLQKAVNSEIIGGKIYDSLHKKLENVNEAQLASASQTLGGGIARKKLQKVIDHYGYLELDYEKLLKVESFSEKTARLVSGNKQKYLDFLAKINGYYTYEQPKVASGDKFKDQVVVFTGVRDKALENNIQENGGTIGSSVNNKTTVLVAKDPSSNSGKMKKALDMGVKIVDISTARKMFD